MVIRTYGITFVKNKFIFMGKQVDEPKQKYSFAAKPSLIEKARKKMKKEKVIFSQKIESLLYDYLSQ